MFDGADRGREHASSMVVHGCGGRRERRIGSYVPRRPAWCPRPRPASAARQCVPDRVEQPIEGGAAR
jgi:hypothetical protein